MLYRLFAECYNEHNERVADLGIFCHLWGRFDTDQEAWMGLTTPGLGGRASLCPKIEFKLVNCDTGTTVKQSQWVDSNWIPKEKPTISDEEVQNVDNPSR